MCKGSVILLIDQTGPAKAFPIPPIGSWRGQAPNYIDRPVLDTASLPTAVPVDENDRVVGRQKAHIDAEPPNGHFAFPRHRWLWATPWAVLSAVWVCGYLHELKFAVMEPKIPPGTLQYLA